MSRKILLRASTTVASTILILMVLAVAFLPSTSIAASHSKIVRGYVHDQSARIVADAEVTVTMKNGATTVTTKTDTSDSTGFYSTTFLQNEWEIGYEIVVTAIYKSLETSNDEPVFCNDAFVQYVNITFPYEIPELGNGFLGVLVTGLILGAVAVVALVVMRKKS